MRAGRIYVNPDLFSRFYDQRARDMTQKPTEDPSSTYDDIIYRNAQRNNLLKGIAFLGLPIVLLTSFMAVKNDVSNNSKPQPQANKADTVQITTQSLSGQMMTYKAVIENKTDTTDLIFKYNGTAPKLIETYKAL